MPYSLDDKLVVAVASSAENASVALSYNRNVSEIPECNAYLRGNPDRLVFFREQFAGERLIGRKEALSRRLVGLRHGEVKLDPVPMLPVTRQIGT
jgi:hypothetical protein